MKINNPKQSKNLILLPPAPDLQAARHVSESKEANTIKRSDLQNELPLLRIYAPSSRNPASSAYHGFLAYNARQASATPKDSPNSSEDDEWENRMERRKSF